MTNSPFKYVAFFQLTKQRFNNLFHNMAASKQNVTPSSYRETLDGAVKVRYDEKLRLIGNEDPYTVDLSDS